MLYKIGGGETMKKVTMYNQVLETGLTYGQAMDAVIHEGKKVSREVWRGYWELRSFPGITNPVLIAVLKDNGGTTTATPYTEDILAKDWMVVE